MSENTPQYRNLGNDDTLPPRRPNPAGAWDQPEHHPDFARPDEPTRVLSAPYPETSAYHGMPLPPVAYAETPAPPQQKRGISRRAALVGAGAGAVGIGMVGAGLAAWLSHGSTSTQAPNLLTDEAGKVGHLLRRAGFGLAPWDAADYVNAGVQGATNRLLSFASISDDLDSHLDTLNLDFTKPDDLARWMILRATYSKRPLEEKMTLFWHGVLTSSITKVGGKDDYPLLVQQDKLLRAGALGRFDDLVRAISTDPAMLWWLDGRLNTGKAPNENYARELMELFSMGIRDQHGNPNYTQNDVHQLALALSGWTVGKGVTQSAFMPSRHYAGNVTVLGHTGPMGIDDAVKLICAHPSTGRYIAWRMWNFFAYELDVSPNPSSQGLSDPVLQPLVDAYYHNDHSIAAMVKAMLTSPAFFSDKAYRARLKSPVELVAGALRGLGVDYDGKNVGAVMRGLGQVPFAPPDVSGWDGDKLSAAWISTETWMARCNFVNALLGAAAGGKGSLDSSPIQQVIASRGLATPAAVADYFVAALLDNHLADDRRAVLHTAISDTSATSGPAFALKGGAKLPTAALRNTLYLLMTMPEYQMN